MPCGPERRSEIIYRITDLESAIPESRSISFEYALPFRQARPVLLLFGFVSKGCGRMPYDTVLSRCARFQLIN